MSPYQRDRVWCKACGGNRRAEPGKKIPKCCGFTMTRESITLPAHRPPLRTTSEVLEVIEDLIETQGGKPPTIGELQEALNQDKEVPPVLSGRTVLRYLRKLEKEGKIQRWDGARGMRVLEGRDTP